MQEGVHWGVHNRTSITLHLRKDLFVIMFSDTSVFLRLVGCGHLTLTWLSESKQQFPKASTNNPGMRGIGGSLS